MNVTFPDVLTPFQMLKKTMVKMKSKQRANCQLTEPSWCKPGERWTCNTWRLQAENRTAGVMVDKGIRKRNKLERSLRDFGIKENVPLKRVREWGRKRGRNGGKKKSWHNSPLVWKSWQQVMNYTKKMVWAYTRAFRAFKRKKKILHMKRAERGWSMWT